MSNDGIAQAKQDTGKVMSENNVELVRRVYMSLTRGDDAWRGLVAPDLLIDFSRRDIDPFIAHGLDDPALASFQSQASELWEGLPAWEPEEPIAAVVFTYLGEDRAAALEAAGLGAR